MVMIPKKLVSKMYICLRKTEVILDKENFDSFIHHDSWIIQDAVIRRLIMVSSISERLMEKHKNFCEYYSEIPFKELSGMKRYLTKVQNGDVDLSLVWETVKKAVPELVAKFEVVFKK